MLSFEQARERILGRAVRTTLERVSVDLALGRVLAEDVLAESALPAFDYSAMDGYALRAADAELGELVVVGEARAGAEPTPLQARTAMRIFTGAPVPSGADSVVPQEDVQRTGDRIALGTPVRIGQHIRPAGQDLMPGALALPRGTRLAPRHVALLATLDRTEVSVSRAPRVVLLATGDELRKPGSPQRAGVIVDCNTPMLAALCRQVGAIVETRHAVDDPEAIRRSIREAMANADVLITIGGVSVGDHDHVRDALASEGVAIDFWKVAMKPGKPLAFGERETCRVLGVPGNPAAAFVAFVSFVAPLLRLMQGDGNPLVRVVRRRLLKAATAGQRMELCRARWVGADQVELLGNQASGAVTSIAWADALVPIPASASLPEGTEVDCWPVDSI